MAKYWGSNQNHRRRSGNGKPFFLRKIFWIPLLVLMVLGLIGLLAVWIYVQPFKQKAETYELSKVGQLPSASFIYDRKGRMIGQIYIQNRYVIPIAEMPEHLREAVMAAEDARFYEHHGVDLYGITRATLRNALAGETQQGASTITQQLARNTFGMKERTVERKITEMFLAWRLEKVISKDQILENYLNLIFLGRGFHGVEAAARGYFGKHTKDLTISESAALAGIIASPNNREPWNHFDSFKGNRDRVLGRMRDLGFINGKELKEAREDPLKVVERVPIKSQSYILDYVRQQVIDIVGWEGATSDGYHVHTTIDLDVQAVAQTSLEKNLKEVEVRRGYEHQTYSEYKKERDAIVNKARQEAVAGGQDPSISPFKLVKPPEYLQGSAIVLENKTGGILAMVGGRDFDHSEFNRATNARVSSGTAFLPFVYGAAFANGFFPGSLVQDGVLDNRRVMIGGSEGILGEWGPESAENRYEGKIPARFALMYSKNAAGVRVGYIAGMENVLGTARRMGIRTPLRQFPATYLGASGTTVLETALAYTNFPNGGWHEEKAQIITEILNSDNKQIYKWGTNRVRGLDELAAYEVHHTLTDAMRDGNFGMFSISPPASKAVRELGLKPFEVAGKTGTAYDFTDVSFYGYSSQITAGVWAGFDTKQRIFEGAFSKDIALPVWVDIMNAAYQEFPPARVPEPIGLEKVAVCLRSGELAHPDLCYETRPARKDGESEMRWPTTYVEFTTREQKPKHVCRLHTGKGLTFRDFLGQGEGGVPTAIPVAPENQQPVLVMSKTVLGMEEDPYHSYKPVEERAQLMDTQKKTSIQIPAKEVLKATVVGPLDRPGALESELVERPQPLDLDRLGQ